MKNKRDGNFIITEKKDWCGNTSKYFVQVMIKSVGKKGKMSFTYSINKTEDYKFRYKMEFSNSDENFVRNIDIYTDDPSKENVEKIVKEKAHEKMQNIKIVHCATKEQDEASAKLIDELT